MRGRQLSPGLYGLADLHIADRFETASITVTAEDVERFADVSGDRFAIHMSEDAARALGFAGRVAHGLLVLSLIDGLKNQSSAQLRAVASLGWDMAFRAPVLVGDSLRASFQFRSRRLTRDGRRGVAVFAVEARNQRDEVIQQGHMTLMMLV